MTAIQLAKAWGATVIVTAGSDAKCDDCLKLGADHAINYKTQDFAAEVQRITAGEGVNVILDMVAGSYVAREVNAWLPMVAWSSLRCRAVSRPSSMPAWCCASD